MNRDDYRKIKSFSKQEMERWLGIEQHLMSERLRKQYNEAYEDELNNSIQNFITAIGYTLHFSDNTNLKQDELASFMDDLFVSVDMFRKGEYNPDEYREQLKNDGIVIAEYDYNALYRACEKHTREEVEKVLLPYKERNDKAIKWINDFISNGPATCNLGDLQQLQNILEGEL